MPRASKAAMTWGSASLSVTIRWIAEVSQTREGPLPELDRAGHHGDLPGAFDHEGVDAGLALVEAARAVVDGEGIDTEEQVVEPQLAQQLVGHRPDDLVGLGAGDVAEGDGACGRSTISVAMLSALLMIVSDGCSGRSARSWRAESRRAAVGVVVPPSKATT